MKRRFLVLVAAAAIVVGAAGQAQATYINYGTASLSNCTNCQDMTFSLSLEFDTASYPGVYKVTFTIGESNQNDFGLGFIDAVDWKVSTDAVTGLQMVTVPDGESWTAQAGKTSSGDGCNTQTGGFHCGEAANDDPANFVAVSANPLTWVFTFTGLGTGSTILTDASTWHIGAGFQNAEGTTTGKTISLTGGGSLDGTPDGSEDGAVGSPEPGSLLLFGTALAFVATRLRRKATK